MTFDELKTNIADWLNRTDLTSVIPTFITLAEARLNRQLRTTNQYTRADISTSDQYLSMPSDFLEMRHIRMTSPKERDLVEIAAHAINEYTDTNFIAGLADLPSIFCVRQCSQDHPNPCRVHHLRDVLLRQDPSTEHNEHNQLGFYLSPRCLSLLQFDAGRTVSGRG
jgi:hypothetical protein